MNSRHWRGGAGADLWLLGRALPPDARHPMTLMSWSSDDQRAVPSMTPLTGHSTALGCPRSCGGSGTTGTAISGGQGRASWHHDEVKLYFWYAHYPRHP